MIVAFLTGLTAAFIFDLVRKYPMVSKAATLKKLDNLIAENDKDGILLKSVKKWQTEDMAEGDWRANISILVPSDLYELCQKHGIKEHRGYTIEKQR